MSVKASFEEHIKLRVGEGNRVLFWLDPWVGDFFLSSCFPKLFACARDHVTP